MAVRDRVVRCALGVGAALALLSWFFVAPWIALALVLLALGTAAVAYRIEAPTIDVDRPTSWTVSQERVARPNPAERVDQ